MVYHPVQRTLGIPAGTLIDDTWAAHLEHIGIDEVWVRSPVTCKSRQGVCAQCYGRDLARSHLANIGEAIGVIAAQSIGEPGTQLTMRRFHVADIETTESVCPHFPNPAMERKDQIDQLQSRAPGARSKICDLVGGLPRVTDLFEARKPKEPALLAEAGGIIRFGRDTKKQPLLIITKDDGETVAVLVPKGRHITVVEGERVECSRLLTDGEPSLHDILRLKGVIALTEYLVREIQNVYRLQGVKINDKHIEVIVRQMLRKVEVTAPGDTRLLRGEQVEHALLIDENARALAEGKQPALFEPLLLGITRSSLTTESFISAASFQETTRVLTEAAVRDSTDRLVGLKENVIVGRLIPAGTGLSYHQERRRQRALCSGKVEMTDDDLEQALRKALNLPEAAEPLEAMPKQAAVGEASTAAGSSQSAVSASRPVSPDAQGSSAKRSTVQPHDSEKKSMQNSVQSILAQLEKTQQDLLGLSDEIWKSIDHNDPQALEQGVAFKKDYNARLTAFNTLTDEIAALLRSFPQNSQAQ
jgi:hypothetical protein